MRKRRFFVCILCLPLFGMLAGCFERGPTKSELAQLFSERFSDLGDNNKLTRFFGDCAKGDGDYYLCEVCEASWQTTHPLSFGTVRKSAPSAKLRKYRVKKTVENDIGWDFLVGPFGGAAPIEGERMPTNDTLPVATWRETAVGWCQDKGFQ